MALEAEDKEKEAEEKPSTGDKIADLPGVGEKTAEKMREAGYTDPMAIAAASAGELSAACGIGGDTANKIIAGARERMQMGFETAGSVLKKRESVGRITTGSKALDEMLGGGVETQAITESHGAYGSGKSQLAHQLAITVQLPPEKGGLAGKAVFVDTEQTFRPERIMDMAKALNLDPKKALDNILCARAYNSDHQVLLVEKAEEVIKKEGVRLLIVDSLTSAFRSDYTGRGTLANRQQKLNRHLHKLQRLADVYNLAIYVTNQVMARPDILFGDPTVPIGGHILGHQCLPPDTLVQLGNGEIIEMENMHNPLEVKGADFADLRIKSNNCDGVFINPSIDEIYEIDAGFKIKSSGNHTFFRLKNFKIEEVPAKTLSRGEYIACTKRINIKGKEQKLPKMHVKRLVFIPRKTSERIKKELFSKKITREQICKEIAMNKRQLRRVLNQEYPTYTHNIKRLIKRFSLDKSIAKELREIKTRKHKNIRIPKILTGDFAQVMGYFLGDGNLEKFSVRFKDQRKEVLLVYKNKFLKLFGAEGNIRKVKDKNCYQLDINSIELRNYFEHLRDKIIKMVCKSPKPVISSFIRGFVDAEGYVGRDGDVTISQKEEKILKIIQLLLLRFSIHSKMSNSNGINRLSIFSTGSKKFGKEIGLSSKEKTDKLMKKTERYKIEKDTIPIERSEIWRFIKELDLYPSKFMHSRISDPNHRFISRDSLSKLVAEIKIKGNFKKTEQKKKLKFMERLCNSDLSWKKITRMEKKQNTNILYDISIPKLRNFIANGVLVHNSTFRLYLRKSKGEKRIAKLIDSPSLPESETVFKVIKEGIRDM
jgi:DNA repair protein RadA